MAQDMPIVDIIDIGAVHGIEILRECVGEPLSGFSVLLIVVLPRLQAFESQKFPRWRCSLVGHKVRVRGEKQKHVRPGHRALVVPDESDARDEEYEA
jgi:hypothetical protein